jgi:signal transduction histidine kinase
LICALGMLLLPARETIPYHLGWAGFALTFGLSAWTRWQLVSALAGYTLVTGLILVRSAVGGNIGWEETTEIPLMFLLAQLMVWHFYRRQKALAQATLLAERDMEASRDRERLMRLTSHEMRTPLTIALGYVDLLEQRAAQEDAQDLAVVADELNRLSRVSDRLVRMIGVQDDLDREVVDLDDVLHQYVERWRVVADRRWELEASAGRVLVSPERLRTCLDTLVENAIRYTSSGDTIRLVGRRTHQDVLLSVHDAGVGLSAEQISAINAGEVERPTSSTPSDPLAGTGLGLGIVRQIVHARGGTLHAGRAPEGGAGLTLSLPLSAPERSPRVSVPTLGRTALPVGYPDLTAPAHDRA